MAQEVHGTLIASTKGTLTVTAAADKQRGGRTVDVEVEAVLVTNGTPSPIYVTTSGTDPTVRGNDTKVVLPGGFRTIQVPRTETQAVEAIGEAGGPWSVEAVSGER